MEIDKSIHQKIVSLVEQFNSFDDFELEGRYTGQIGREEFDRCINYCKSYEDDFEENIEEDVLDIILNYGENSYRISLSGSSKISGYCKTNIINDKDDVIVIKKTLEAKPVVLEDIDFKINLKKEASESDPSDIIDRLYLLEKSYRFKKRYSYINKKDGVRVDLTVVKSAIGSYKSFLDSKIVNKPDTYEIEIELIQKKDPKVSSGIFINHMLNLYGAIVDEENVCSKKEKLDVIKEYLKLCYKEVPLNYEKVPKLFFAGPQPITLEKKNIIKPGPGVTTIREDYTVTEKADGERYLLYISKIGRCYFINSRLSVKFTGVTVTTIMSTLLDGEYITTDILGEPIRHYAVFDAYYVQGNDIRSLPLVGIKDSRLSNVTNVLEKVSSKFEKEDITIYTKEFLFGDNIFGKTDEILKKIKIKAYPYSIDGVIYTPMYIPVGGMFLEDKPDKPSGTWPMVFKWKPPQDNTIDFLVKVRKGNSNNPVITFINSIPHRILDLYVGYDPSSWDKIRARNYLEGNVTRKKSYVAIGFKPADVVDDGITSCYIKMNGQCENGDTIDDDSIIEFKYDNSDEIPPFQLKWSPIRVRKDKTEMYRKTKSLSGAVNDLGSAMNIWRSIRYPVSEEMISGKEVVDVLPKTEDVYYDRKMKREKFASRPMLLFHNEIKKDLINKYKATSCLDLACGQGGDLRKFMDAGFTRLFGLDYNRDNIENPISGIYARMLDNKNPAIQKMRYAFLTMDVSQKIDIKSISDLDDKHVANVLYGVTKDAKMRKYEGLAEDKFDVVSCQFAIHYFFESEKKLDNFLNNVNTHLKEGGYFFGTCLDGQLVKKALAGVNILEGKQNNRILWSLKRLYPKLTGVGYGEEIDIYMESIGQYIKEYLVNIDLLNKKMKALGYEMVENKNFQDFYMENYGLDDVQKDYSFLNMMFVFKKKSVKPMGRVFKKKVPVDE